MVQALRTLQAPRARVLLVGVDEASAAWLRTCLTTVADTVAVPARASLAEAPLEGVLAVVTAPERGCAPLALPCSGPWAELPIFALVSHHEPRLHDDERFFFTIPRTLRPPDVAALVYSAFHRRSTPETPVTSHEVAARISQVASMAARFAQHRELASAAAAARDAITRLTAADRAECIFHDTASGAIWTEGPAPREGHAVAGLVGFAARTGQPCAVLTAREDPRFCAAVDDPHGDGAQSLLVQPVVALDGRVHAVFVAARDSKHSAFGSGEHELLASFAARVGPWMDQLAELVEADALLRSARDANGSFYREEAVAAHRGAGTRGDVVRVLPPWIAWASWGLLWVAVASAVFLCLSQIRQYSQGAAVVRMHARTDVTAKSGGALVALEAAAGDHVEAGQLLARLDDGQARNAVETLQREFDDRLRARMLAPDDENAMSSVLAVRGRLDVAQGELAQREVRAPHAGMVGELRIRPGQHVNTGDIVASVLRETDEATVLAFLPGQDRPQLQEGMRMRLEVGGYRYAYQELEIEWVGDEVIGPVEARRYLDPQVADSLEIVGPVVPVRARLGRPSFEADGERFSFHDGMLGTVEVAVRTESAIVTLFPFLKQVGS